MQEAVIVGALRSPIGKFQGALAGLPASDMGGQVIRSGDADAIIAGGQENMSAALHALPHSRTGQQMGSWQLIDTMITDRLGCAINNYHMGQTAGNVAAAAVEAM